MRERDGMPFIGSKSHLFAQYLQLSHFLQYRIIGDCCIIEPDFAVMIKLLDENDDVENTYKHTYMYIYKY